jgi:hypothetical protein
MKTQNSALFLFLILIAGLILSSFLGGRGKEGFAEVSTYTGVNSGKSSQTPDWWSKLGGQGNVYTGPSKDVQTTRYDNYNHHDGTSYPTMYYGPNGSNAKLVNSNGVYSLIVTDNNGKSSTYSIDSHKNSKSKSDITATYYGKNGGNASIIISNGSVSVKVVDSNGNSTTYTSQNPQIKKYTDDDKHKNDEHKNKTGTDYATAYADAHKGDARHLNSAGKYSSVLPAGISKSQIPKGHEDLYILKSQVIPPVCPVCPVATAATRDKPCPPCPACARCPEPSFECKKVPNYNSISSEYLPQPVLSSFSSFGM